MQLDPNFESPHSLARQCAVSMVHGVPVVAVLRTLGGGEGDEVLLVEGNDAEREVRRVTVFERVGKILAEQARGEDSPAGEEEGTEAPKFVLETLRGEILESEFRRSQVYCRPATDCVRSLQSPSTAKKTRLSRRQRSPRFQSSARTSRPFCSLPAQLLRHRSASPA